MESRFCPFADALPHSDRRRHLGERPSQPRRRVQRRFGTEPTGGRRDGFRAAEPGGLASREAGRESKVSGGGAEGLTRLPPGAGPDHDAGHRAPCGRRESRSVMQQGGRGDSSPKSVASRNRAVKALPNRNLPPIASSRGGPTSGSHRTIEAHLPGSVGDRFPSTCHFPAVARGTPSAPQCPQNIGFRLLRRP